VDGIEVVPVNTLAEAVEFLSGRSRLHHFAPMSGFYWPLGIIIPSIMLIFVGKRQPNGPWK